MKRSIKKTKTQRILKQVAICVAGLSLAACSTESDDTDSTPADVTPPAVDPAGGSNNNPAATSTTPALTAAEVSLDALPSTSSLVAGGSSASLALAVTGTPTKLRETKDNLDQIYFGGVLADIASAGSSTEEQRGQLERGDALCRLATNNADVFSDLIGGTMCYMQNAPKQTTGLTVVKASDTVTSADYSKVFAQESADKHVQIRVTQSGQTGMIANMIIPGSTSSPDAYKVNFYMCKNNEGSLALESIENYTVDFATGLYSSTGSHGGSFVYEGEDQTYVGAEIINAYLIKSGSNFVFDPAKDKVIQSSGTDSSDSRTGVRKRYITIDSNSQITAKAYGTATSSGNSESEKIYSISAISGAGHDIAMPEAGMRMERTWTYSGTDYTSDPFGAVEWNTDTYANTESSTIYQSISDFSFDSDDFYSAAPTAPTFESDKYDCSTEGDVILAWDMEDTSFTAVESICDSGSSTGLGQLDEMCNDSSINAAFNTGGK